VERGQAAEELEDFLARRGKPLLRAAVLLTGSQEAGEDLLQAALERLLGRSLPPTRANLTHLAAPIPAGFTQSHQRPEAAYGFFGTMTAWMFGQ
jgi:hypothetical protein